MDVRAQAKSIQPSNPSPATVNIQKVKNTAQIQLYISRVPWWVQQFAFQGLPMCLGI